MREQVVGLEDDADAAAHRVDVAGTCDVRAVEEDATRVDGLQQVDAAEQRRLAGARRTDQRDHLVLCHAEVDLTQHLVLAERLRQALYDERLAHITPPDWRRRRSRRINQSVNRASGIVIDQNRSAASR